MAMMTQEVAMATEEEQLVVFELAAESYGVDIGAVNTIIRMQRITHVPRAPEFVEGVINLRGSIVPVLDLRNRFGLEAFEETKASRIVVVETSAGAFGLIVDAVTETLSLSRDLIEPPSCIVTTADSHYLRGVGKLEERLIILLDIERIVGEQEAEALMEAMPAFSEIEEPVATTAAGPAEGPAAMTAAGRPEEDGAGNLRTRKPNRSRANGKRERAGAKVGAAAE